MDRPLARIPRVLFVEDDVDIRETLAELLRDEGHEVVEAGSAEDGLAQLREQSFDVVLSDYHLPAQSGTWMIEQARQEGRLLGAVPLLLTASSHLDGAGELRVLTKPIDVDELCREIAAAVAAPRGADLAEPPPREPRPRVELVLFVHGESPSAQRSRQTLHDVLAAHGLSMDCVRIVDVATAEGVALAAAERVAFTPALLRASPAPKRWVIGDLRQGSSVARILRDSGARRT